ncbi:uncharacterized protein LOC129703082 [Leucoraja erinacea]|uniref:uncharacterized protein LOC129703082 n=1 Tax=Leucoraja erinaceus TaxID=7782 RepID=UPI0024550EE7|nr:uncharacterized protein LOC129703082 [Leucoraja erinacea]
MQEAKDQGAGSPAVTGRAGSPRTFGGLQRGFLLRRLEPRVSGRPLGRGSRPHSDTELPQSLRDPTPTAGTQPVAQSQTHATTEQRSKVKLKCKNVFKLQQGVSDHLDEMMTMDWGHPDVTAAISRHPRLPQQMRDPHFAQTMRWLQDDPEGFMQHFEESDEEMIFVKDLLEIIGDILQARGSQGSVRSFVQSLGLGAQEEAQLNSIAEHPDIRGIISDPLFQDTLSEMSKDPSQAERLLQSKDARFRAGLTTLLSAGVLDILLADRSPSPARETDSSHSD